MTSESIIKRCIELCPDLAPVKKIRVYAGLRPTRVGGIRLEQEVKNINGREVLFVHNYGHGNLVDNYKEDMVFRAAGDRRCKWFKC